MNLGMRKHQREWGESVLWFEFNPGDSQKHPIYDEGPSRVWFPPFVLPVLFIDFQQNPPAPDTDGLYNVASAAVTFQLTEALNRFRVDPTVTVAHFRDRFSYGGIIFTVVQYEKRGLVNGIYLTISCRAEQVKEEEFFNDFQAKDFFLQQLVY